MRFVWTTVTAKPVVDMDVVRTYSPTINVCAMWAGKAGIVRYVIQAIQRPHPPSPHPTALKKEKEPV